MIRERGVLMAYLITTIAGGGGAFRYEELKFNNMYQKVNEGRESILRIVINDIFRHDADYVVNYVVKLTKQMNQTKFD